MIFRREVLKVCALNNILSGLGNECRYLIRKEKEIDYEK